MSQIIPATKAFREKVAAAVASGGLVPAITHVAWGTDGTAETQDDIALGAEIYRHMPTTSADGTVLTVDAILQGDNVTGSTLREVGVIDSDGDLAGRRAFAPKQLETETDIEATLELQF